MKNATRVFGAALTLAVAFCALGGVNSYATTADTDDKVWFGDKTASELNPDGASDVKLTLPAGEEEFETDIVFVLDKSTSATVEDDALKMLSDLKDEITNQEMTKVKVGVVIFNKVANPEGYFDLATEYGKIEASIKREIKSGTNIHAGLLAAKNLLADGGAANGRKYMILVSDGITYMYNENPTATYYRFSADSILDWVGPDNYKSAYGSNDAPSDWNAFFAKAKTAKDNNNFCEYHLYGEQDGLTSCRESDKKDQKDIDTVTRALYETYALYEEICAEINCYAMANGSNTDYVWGPDFIRFLAGDKQIDFSTIEKEILYLVDKGTLTDKMGMGKTEDGQDYKFEMDTDSFELYVGGEKQEGKVVEEDNTDLTIVFCPTDAVQDAYKYILRYYKKDGLSTGDENYFDLIINEAIKISAPLMIKYRAVLETKPELVGTYGEYDEDGSEGFNGLYTNNDATLDYTSTDGTEGSYTFQKPTVQYVVEAGKGEEPETPADEVENPRTGDNFAASAAIMVISAIAFAGSAIYTKKN